MRIKTLFSIPDGEKVTEKVFGRVLLSSICSILLCMTCLVGTTWAWFTVSIENTENVIQIAVATETVTITNASNTEVESDNGVYRLDSGTYSISVCLANNATQDDLNKEKEPVYVVMTAMQNGQTKYYCFTFEGSMAETQSKELKIESGSAQLSFSVSWIKPVSAAPVDGGAIVIGEIPTEPTASLPTTPFTQAAETTGA